LGPPIFFNSVATGKAVTQEAAAHHPTSLAIFISNPAQVSKTPLADTNSSCTESAANLFGCDPNGTWVSSAISHWHARQINFRMRIQAGAKGGAPKR
jgi:hypothetical protein